MIADLVLAIGIVLSNATQLRVESLPIGPGELTLALWVCMNVFKIAFRTELRVTKALSYLLRFWLVFTFAQCLGLIVGLAIEQFRDNLALIHNVIAYALAASLSILFVSTKQGWDELRPAIWMIAIVGVASLVLQVAQAAGLYAIPGLSPWYWDRLRGWSENPNQLALLAAVLALLSLFLAEMSRSSLERIAALTGTVICLFVGMLTKSDSFILFGLIASPLYVLFTLWSWLDLPRSHALSLRTTFAGLALICIPAAFLAISPLATTIVERADKFTQSTYEKNNQAEDRFKLWHEAIEISLGAGLLGLGPGPHLTSKDYKRPPPAKFEAHNTPLDLLTQGGVIAVASFIWLMVTALVVTLRARMFALSALILATGIFCSFHLVIRQPVLWLTIAICLAAVYGRFSARTSIRSSGRNATQTQLPRLESLTWMRDSV